MKLSLLGNRTDEPSSPHLRPEAVFVLRTLHTSDHTYSLMIVTGCRAQLRGLTQTAGAF